MRPPTLQSSRIIAIRSLHISNPALAATAILPPVRKSAADLGFSTRNEGRVRDLPRFDIPASTRTNIGGGNISSGSSRIGGDMRLGQRAGGRSSTGRVQVQAPRRDSPSLQLGDAAPVAAAQPQVRVQRERRPLAERASIPSTSSTSTPGAPADAPMTPVQSTTTPTTEPTDFFEHSAPSTREISSAQLDMSLFENPIEASKPKTSDRTPTLSPSARSGQPRPFAPSQRAPYSPRTPYNGTRTSYAGPRTPGNASRANGLGPRKPRAKTARPQRVTRTSLAQAARKELRGKEPPPPVPVDRSIKALFGRGSLVTKGVRGSRDPTKEIWAEGLSDVEARKMDVLRLAGSYDSILPKIAFPSDVQVATKPLDRARSALSWGMALNSSVSLQGAKRAREVLKGFIG